MGREILTDGRWERLAPLLPPQKPPTGRPAKDHRAALEAILWVPRTGASWRDLPAGHGPWRSAARPKRVVGDKGYSSAANRAYLRRRGIAAVIPRRRDQGGPQPRFDRGAYRQRNRVERLINRLKQFRRVATRYEKRAANYLAMLTLAAILLWLSPD